MRTRRMVAAGIGALAAATFAASPATASTGGTEHFLAVNTSTANNAPAPLAATGPIHALGKDVTVANGKDRFVFPKGAIVVIHKATKSSQSYDPGSCTGRFDQQGTFKVVSGTGAYAHVQGSGTFTLNGIFLGCGKTPIGASVIIRATGSLSF